MKRRKLTYLQLLVLAGIFLFSANAFSGSDTTVEFADETMLFHEIPSVYSASKYEQKSTQAPSSVSIITADEIRKYGYRDLGEILASVRGFVVTYDRNYKFLGIRGFGLPSDYSNRILLLVDGVKTNDNIYDAPLIGHEFPLDIDLIDRIEIVRGPSSSLYGSNAFFGIVNVITKNGRNYKGAELSAEAGTFSTYKNRLSYGNRFQNGMEMLVSSSYYQSRGDGSLDYSSAYEDNPWICQSDDPADCYRLADIWPSNTVTKDLDSERFRNFFAKFTVGDLTVGGNFHERKKFVPTAPWETIFGHGNNYTVDTRSWIDLTYEHTYADRLSVAACLNYNYYKYTGEYPYEGDPSEGEAAVVTGSDIAEGKWFDGEIKVSKPYRDHHYLMAGASFQVNIKQFQGSSFSGADDWGELDDTRHSDNWGLYIQDEYTISEHLRLSGGLRYDHYKTFDGTFNPRVAVIYNPSGRSAFKAIYGRAFRAPSVYELYYNDGNTTAKANPDLDPEIIDTYELIYEHFIGKYLNASVTGFYYGTEGIIKQETDPSDGLLVFNNTGKITAKGVAFEMEGKKETGLEGRISYTFQTTKEEDTGRTLSNSPRHIAKANIIIPFVEDRVFLGIEEKFTSRRATLYRERQEALPSSLRNDDYPSNHFVGSYFLTNITLYIKNLPGDLEASASVYNLFNKKYADPGAGEHFQDAIDQDGRTFRLKITFSF